MEDDSIFLLFHVLVVCERIKYRTSNNIHIVITSSVTRNAVPLSTPPHFMLF